MQKKRTSIFFITGAILLLAFLVFTVLVKTVDLAVFTPTETEIGFSSLNCAVFEAIGQSDLAYEMSEILGIFVLVIPFVFALLALVQWIKRRSLLKIDRDLWILFAAYALTIALYCFFELVVINYRPILVDGAIEASYPSSHTLLAIVIGGSALLQIIQRFKKKQLKIPLLCLVSLLTVAVPLLRLLAGVHWVTDIAAAVLLGGSILCFYHSFVLHFRELE